MKSAQELGEVIFADIALLGFEYMALSYNHSDDPIDVQTTITLRLRAIEFLNGNRSPTKAQLSWENIYKYV